MEDIEIKKKHVLIFLATFFILVIGFFSYPKMSIVLHNSGPSIMELKQEYSMIPLVDRKGSCGALNHANNGDILKGSCCGQMNEERYVKQRSYLNKYMGIDEIPKDPWNVPASLARELTKYGKNIILNQEEQAVYDGAIEIFDEGPCCCKCWRWFAFDGLAKKMIRDENFTSQQIAELWASEDVCGDEDPFSEISEIAVNQYEKRYR